MSVKLAVLGLIIERRGYGYDLLCRFDDRFAAWKVNQSTVYDALDTLYREGRIVTLDRTGAPLSPHGPARSPKVVYEATEIGRQDFVTWLTAPVGRVEPVRAEILLKVALASQEHALPLLQLLDAHLDACTNELAELLARYELVPDGAQSVTWPVAAAYYVSDAAIGRLQGDLAWLRRVRAGVEALRLHGAVPLSALVPAGGASTTSWR